MNTYHERLQNDLDVMGKGIYCIEIGDIMFFMVVKDINDLKATDDLRHGYEHIQDNNDFGTKHHCTLDYAINKLHEQLRRIV